MSGIYFFAKALHIIGFVAWFAGLFYIVRMFVYHIEADDRPELEKDILKRQFSLMEWRVHRIINNPAMVITWVGGLVMLYLNGWPWLAANPWMYIKLALLLLLTTYHFWCGRIAARLESGEKPFTSFQFRLLNELPTLFLVTIVLLAVYRNTLNFLFAFIGLVGFGVLLYLGAKWYRKFRSLGV